MNETKKSDDEVFFIIALGKNEEVAEQIIRDFRENLVASQLKLWRKTHEGVYPSA